MSLPLRFDRFVWDGPYAGSFEPDGEPMLEGGVKTIGLATFAARLVTGLGPVVDHVGRMRELARAVRDARRIQSAAPALLIQGGNYRHRDERGAYQVERGAQIGLLEDGRTTCEAFEADMVELAEMIARAFRQPVVIVEIQERGAVRAVHAVSAD